MRFQIPFVKMTLEIRQEQKCQKTIGAAGYMKKREANSYIAEGDRRWVNHFIKINTENDFDIMIL